MSARSPLLVMLALGLSLGAHSSLRAEVEEGEASDDGDDNDDNDDNDDSGYVVWGRPAQPRVAGVEEISRRALDQRGVTDAAEALATSPAVMATTGSRGERTITLRGFDQRQTLILIDGVPAYVPFDGQLDLSMLPAEMIDHVTVVKGPSALLLGPNGLGGAVNIVTRQPGRGPFLEGRVEAASPSRGRAAGFHSLRLGRFSYAVFGGRGQREAWSLPRRFVPTAREDGGARDNSDQLRVHAGASARLELTPDQTLRASGLLLEGAHGVPASLSDPAPRYWRFEDWRLVGVGASHEGRYGALELHEHLYARRVANTLEGYDDASYSSQESARGFRSVFEDDVLGAGLRARLPLAPVEWAALVLRGWAGLQHDRHHELPTDDEPARVVARTLISAAPLAELYLLEAWQLTLACQLDLELLEPAIDGERVGPLGLGPLAALRFEPRPWLALGLSTARRTRFPTLKERHARVFGARLPNPQLAPEAAWHLGAELDWRPSSRLSLAASVFDAEVQDLIERIPLGAGREQLQNVGAARLLGAELELTLRAARGLDLLLGYAWLSARRTDASPPDDQLSYRPEHKGLLGVVARPTAWLELTSQLRAIGPQRYQHPVTLAWERMSTYGVWDARAALHPLPGLELWGRATNLLDVNYHSEIGFPDPGRTLWLGLRIWVGQPDA